MLRFCGAGLLALGGLAAAHGQQFGDPRVADDVFYHYMPIAWRDSDHDTYRFGDFGGMTAALDYLESLGITAVWMNPVFPSPAYHGYQHGRADQLNPWFGDEAGFRSFILAAHARGIRVFVDLVCYGISHDSPWFQSAYNNPASPYDTWLAFTNAANTQYLGSVYNTWNGASVGFIHWDLRSPGASGLVTSWAQKWLDPNQDGDLGDGLDGYRLDHVWVQYGSGPDGWGYNLDDFWAPWKQALQAVNPNVFIFAEQADWGITGATLLPVFDATFTKPFEFAARAALANETAGGLYSSMAAALAELPAGKTFLGTLGDHDVDRLTSVLGGSLEKAKAAAAILLTQPFPPVLYFGDEIGMRGTKGNWGSDANDIPMREPFKWNAVAGPPMSNYWVLSSSAYNNRFAQDHDGRSVEEQSGVAGSLLEEYRRLIALRHAHVALRRGTYHAITAGSTRIWSFLRHASGQETLLVAINLYGAARTTNLDLTLTDIPGGATPVVDIATGQQLTPLTNANKAAYPLTVPAYGWRILAVNLTPLAPPPNTIDGRSIPTDFAAPDDRIATQNSPTNLGNNVSELNQLLAHPEPNGLRIGLTGNLAPNGTGLCILIDTAAGGQNVLRIENYPVPPYLPGLLTGLRLDEGFAPDHLLFINAGGSTFWLDQFTLPAAGALTKTWRGSGTINSGSGYLSGGTNPNGIQLALDNTNVLGVTDTDASGAATATTGVELYIPYADLGLPAGPGGALTIAAFLAGSDGNVSNQWLPGVGPGYGNLGPAPDMRNIPGAQFATVLLDRRGDLNCDNAVNFDDIDAFVAALAGAASYAAQYPDCAWRHGDFNGDGAVTFDDIDPFVARLAE